MFPCLCVIIVHYCDKKIKYFINSKGEIWKNKIYVLMLWTIIVC